MRAFVLILALTVCCEAVAQSNSGSKADLKAFVQQEMAIRKAIADAYARWVDATKKKDVDAVMALYTDDAVMLPDKADTAKGKEEIREFYKRWYSGNEKLIRQAFTDTGSFRNTSDDLVIETADFLGVSEIDGKEISFRGKNLVVWKRQTDGTWKIFRDIWNSSEAPK